MITDFEEITATRRFDKVETPAALEGYSVYVGGNFIFIKNARQMTVRFHLPNFGSKITAEGLQNWIERIKRLYPNF
ncbi:hypothetical protein HNQ91_003345 [Filimonas zeae]|uniref:hypothetical protein n=1 Tax=Filimonas zeae TaxID=1737353 RepID=UPI00166CC05F|nr:hypothetical protein [Filimonas zeae]MDR6340280.1 hypothetical protein [Filimonas zeae]